MKKLFLIASIVASAALVLILTSSCSSTPAVKKQAYANLPSEKTFEYEFPVVWKGIEAAFTNYKVTDRDPDDVGELEMKKLRERSLKTDWIITQSRDKYEEYKVNGFPRKVYLQSRVRYQVVAKTVLGGVHVGVRTDEEVEKLKNDGSSAGFSTVNAIDSSRANEILQKIENSILSAAP